MIPPQVFDAMRDVVTALLVSLVIAALSLAVTRCGDVAPSSPPHGDDAGCVCLTCADGVKLPCDGGDQ